MRIYMNLYRASISVTGFFFKQNGIQFWILKEGTSYELFHSYPFMSFYIGREDINRKVFRIKPSRANNIFFHV